MQRKHVGIAVWITGLLLAGAIWAQEAPQSRWNVSLETRAQVSSNAVDGTTVGYGGLLPKVSYFVNDRWRIDTGVGFADSDAAGLELHLFPGVRYYYFQPENRRFRLNGGVDLRFELFHTTSRTQFGLAPDGGLVRLDEQDEYLNIRLVPVELEFWAFDEGAFTLGVDYGGTLLEGGDFDVDGLGILGGFRWRF